MRKILYTVCGSEVLTFPTLSKKELEYNLRLIKNDDDYILVEVI